MELISEETKNKLNDLLTHSFLLNMICDNAVYQIDYDVYSKAAGVTHEKYAHYWPVAADMISEKMIQLNSKPVRGNLTVEYKDYGGDLAAIYKDIAEATDAYRKDIIDTIEIADLNEDIEVRIFCENFLEAITPYRKQADVWATEAERYKDNYRSFDARFETFTFI